MFDFNTETGRIRAYGIIGEFEDGVAHTDFITAFDAMGGRDVTIQLQSDGGDVKVGMSIFNQIENYPGRVEVHVDAMAASIATVFPMAADKVVANRNATMMVHRAWAMAIGDALRFRQLADVLEKLDYDIAEIYAAKSGGTPDWWMAKMAAETYFTAAEALEVGLIDEVIGTGAKAKNMNPVAVCGLAGSPQIEAALLAKRLKLKRLQAG